MRKVLTLFLMILSEHVIGQTFIRLRDGAIIPDSTTTLTRRTVENVEKGILVTYELDYAQIIPDGSYPNASIVRIDRFGLNGEIEAPATPIKIDRFSVPSRDTKVILLDSTYIDLPIEIGPVRPVRENNNKMNLMSEFIPPIKPYSGFYPKSLVSHSINAYRKSYIDDIRVTPVLYNYQEKIVRIYTKFSYLVDFGDTKHICNEDNNDPLLLNLVGNKFPVSMQPRIVSTEVEVPGFLILSVPKYTNAVNKLADWKRSIGFNVQTIIQNTWSTSDVTNAITTSFSNDSINYLLIVGDSMDVPGMMITDSIYTIDGKKYYTFTTDYYYGCVQQNTYPEIRRGRIPVSTASQAMTVVDKIIRYEKEPVTQHSFYETGLNCAYFEDKYNYNYLEVCDSIEDTRCVLTSENIRDYLVNEKGKAINRVYSARSDVNPLFWNNHFYGYSNIKVGLPDSLLRSNGFLWNGDAANIAQHLNEGVFYVLHRDHGMIARWWEPTFGTTHINNLSNGDKLPVVFSMSCLTGKYNGTTCFAESFLRKEGGGCVAIFAASETSLAGYNDALTIGMFDAIWPSNGYFKSFPYNNSISLSLTPSYRLGDILDIGLSHISSIYDSYSERPFNHTKLIFHCFGDPTMEMYTEMPTRFNSISYSVENGVINLSVPEEGKITFYNPLSGTINSFWGSNVQFPYNSNLHISITKHNKIPFMIDAGTIYIQNETISENVYYEGHSIKVGSNETSTKSIGDVIISSGLTILRGNDVELGPGTQVEEGAQLEINN